jgi:crotonobetainyl-CoA:carnitine CoA-transferase CaiB-like acyl-CoA transferase
MAREDPGRMVAPLEGIQVVEVATYLAAPSSGALLADLGAEVIKVEVPQGEIYRYSRPSMVGLDSDFPESPGFQMNNRGKRSLALDLNRAEARKALERVIGRADVLLTNLLPSQLKKYELDPESQRQRRPALIYATLTAYGLGGKEADTPSFDYGAYWARTGMMDLTREPESIPAFQRPGVGDHAAGLSLVCGILAALRVRDRTGRGQLVDVSLLQTGLYVLGSDVALGLVTHQTPKHHDRRAPANPLWNQYRTQDGRWLFLVMIRADRYWTDLCAAIERPDLIEDARFSNGFERHRNAQELVKILDEVFATRSLAEWEERLNAHALVWSPVRKIAEVLEDPQARAMKYFRSVDHPTAGRFETVAPPLCLSEYEMRAERPAPALGADSESVLREAGLSESEITAALGPSPKV